ncbi:hypothetical protein [Campylobacter jejuni]|uniref:hypothetical protein n=1 Tax=Campylobacter jejuni TaxID=197 RepID=UPI00073DEBDE|nr:hypothetical protein [Campylobacter jejuni]ALW15615.1 hypothetical protein RC26_02680 [Campylobacter jejuni]HED5364338.1 hypothetical protein [Campylobacter jejuni]
MIVVLKSVSGVDYKLYNENKQVIKTISLKGGCFMNNVDDDDYKELVKQYPSFNQAIEDGFIIISKNKNVNTQKVVDDTLQEVKNKQDKAKKNALNKGVEIVEGV